MRNLLAAALATLLLLSGCLADSSGKDPDRDSQTLQQATLQPFENPLVLDHDHGDLAEHQKWNNIELVGRVGFEDIGIDPVTLGEIDVAGNYAYVAVFGHGFAIFDLSNVTDPKFVSLTEIPALSNPPVVGPVGPVANPVSDRYMADLKVDVTGDWVFVAPELSETPGVLIYDARDRANPVLAGFWPQPGLLLGCHMIEYAIISEQEYVFCAPLDNAVYVGLVLPAAGPERQIVTVARWVPNSAAYAQGEVDGLTSDPAGTAGRYVLSGHQDMTYQPDPLTGRPTLFVSFWNLGLRIVDVSIPAAPLEVGFWEGKGSDDYQGNFHTAMAFESEGRRIAVAIPEGPDPPALFILDATNEADPVVLSSWSALPSFTDSTGSNQAGSFSLHNFQIVDGKVYLCMGHGGIWVLDISTPEKQANPEPLASFYPNAPRPDGEDYAPYPWDVNVWHGYMLDAEGNGGLYVLHYLGDPAGDEQYNGFA